MMRVEVCFSPAPRTTEIMQLQLTQGATVRDALQASGLWARMANASATKANAANHDATAPDTPRADDWQGLRLAVFGAPVTLETVLAHGDRLDCCRPLRVDPKLARRERFNKQGAGRSGLFAKRRPGSVPGY